MKNTALTEKTQNITQLNLVKKRKQETLIHIEKMPEPDHSEYNNSRQTSRNSATELDTSIVLQINEIDIFEETFGRVVAEELIVLVNSRLVGCLRSGDMLEQTNTNEFIITIADLDSKDFIKAVVKRIEACCNGEYVCSDLKLHLSVAVGVSISAHNSISNDEQLRYARIALRKVMREPNDSIQFYSPEMLDDLKERAKMIIELRQAIKNNRFVLHYQPQYEVKSQETVGLEALLRLKSESGELIYPDNFIGLAEETGLILPIGHWVIQEACLQYRRWQDQGCAPKHIAVNVSSKQLIDNSLLEIVDVAVKEAGIEYSNLEIEITEQQLIQHIDIAENVLTKLNAKGVRIALDDFGTGYSSLAYLAQLPLNILKIDRSFLQQLKENERTAGLIRSIIYLAKELGLKVVAEGIETPEQQSFIQSVGCHLGQGYGYARPQDVEQITPLLQSRVMG